MHSVFRPSPEPAKDFQKMAHWLRLLASSLLRMIGAANQNRTSTRLYECNYAATQEIVVQ